MEASATWDGNLTQLVQTRRSPGNGPPPPAPPTTVRAVPRQRLSMVPHPAQGADWVGRYRIVRSLGSGGMAEVFLGTVDSIGGFERRVAIKVVHRRLLQDEEFVTMLLDEARIAGLVNHANVVSVHDVHHSGNQLYLVMDYVEGVTLDNLANSLWEGGGSVPIEITMRVGLDLLSALEAIHDLRGADGQLLQVVHRDVSPRNVLVGTDGICRLTDFGIARARGRLTETPQGVIKGTLGYVAPEALTGRPVDQRADLYSLGVLLWELLAGQRLFTEGDAVLGRHDPRLAFPATRVVSPRQHNPNAPQPVVDVCMKALEPEPEDRHETASEMGTALEDAMAEAGIKDVGSRLTGRLVAALERMQLLAPQPRRGLADR